METTNVIKQIPNIINNAIDSEGYTQNSKYNITSDSEFKLHRKHLSEDSLVSISDTIESLFGKYLLASHSLTKIKRTDPNQKIIDAYDIDWSGYEVTLNGVTYKPKTTFELLDLIFSLLKYLYDLHGATDVIWNDSGVNRSSSNKLDWFYVPTGYGATDNAQTDDELIDSASKKTWN